jgi:hypothetical protein
MGNMLVKQGKEMGLPTSSPTLQIVASVNGDGVKTMKQLLDELYTQIADQNLSIEAKLVYNSAIYALNYKSSTYVTFSILSAASSFGTIDEAYLSNGSSIYRRWIFRTTGNQFDNTSYTDSVVPSARSIEIYDYR